MAEPFSITAFIAETIAEITAKDVAVFAAKEAFIAVVSYFSDKAQAKSIVKKVAKLLNQLKDDLLKGIADMFAEQEIRECKAALQVIDLKWGAFTAEDGVTPEKLAR